MFQIKTWNKLFSILRVERVKIQHYSRSDVMEVIFCLRVVSPTLQIILCYNVGSLFTLTTGQELLISKYRMKINGIRFLKKTKKH